MRNSENNIDQIFRDGLQNHKVIPPADVWATVKTGIPGARKPFSWTKVAAAAIILIMAGTSLVVIFRGNPKTGSGQEELVQKTPVKSSPLQKKTNISPAHKKPANPAGIKSTLLPSGSDQKGEINSNHPDFVTQGSTNGQGKKAESLAYLPLKVPPFAPSPDNSLQTSLVLRSPEKFNNLSSLAPLSLDPSFAQNNTSLSSTGQYGHDAKKSKRTTRAWLC